MANLAEFRLNESCFFELTVRNLDKGVLDSNEVSARASQDFGGHGLIVSNAGRFTEKSNIYAGGTFLVGADTAIRICDLRYYNGKQSEMDDAIAEIRDNGCRFMVFGRMIANKFIDSKNIQISDHLHELCTFVDRGEFELNISSTQMRQS